MLASALGNILIIDLICKNRNTDHEYEDSNGFNCLYYATYYGHIDIVRHLKEKWNVPYKPSKSGTTCLHVAVRRGHADLVEFFLDKLKESDKDKFAAMSQERLQFYNNSRRWEQAIDVDEQKKDDGVTAVFIAVKQKNLPILKILRKYGADF